jgi:predicted HD phosphohydrolase
MARQATAQRQRQHTLHQSPLEVAKLVDQATGGKDTDRVIAALLHDAIEDQGISRAQISGQFGEEVATLVEEVSDDKSLPQDVRKHLQVERAAAKSPRAKSLSSPTRSATSRTSARIRPRTGPSSASGTMCAGAAMSVPDCAARRRS